MPPRRSPARAGTALTPRWIQAGTVEGFARLWRERVGLLRLSALDQRPGADPPWAETMDSLAPEASFVADSVC